MNTLNTFKYSEVAEVLSARVKVPSARLNNGATAGTTSLQILLYSS